MHRVMREGAPAANDAFIGSLCKTAADASPADAARSRDTLLNDGINALQATMGGKSADRLLTNRRRVATAGADENIPSN